MVASWQSTGDGTHGEFIPVTAKTRDTPGRHRRHHAGATPRLTSIRVRQMHLDDDALIRRQRIMERPRTMGERARVDDDRRTTTAGPMDRFDEFALVVRLKIFNGEIELGRTRTRPRHVISKRCRAIHLGFTGPEKVQIRAMEQQDESTHATARYCADDTRYSTCGHSG